MTTPSDVLHATGMMTAHRGMMDSNGSDRLHLPHIGGAEPRAPGRDSRHALLANCQGVLHAGLPARFSPAEYMTFASPDT